MESHNPNRQICWPEFSQDIPIEFAGRLPKIRKDVWPRMQAGLYLMSTNGWSVVQELILPLAERFGLSPRADSLHRIYRMHLPKSGLVIYKTLPLFRKYGLAVVHLSKLGKSLSAQLGWKVVRSDWEKLIEEHEGEEQLHHTAMVLDFVWQARIRGYTANILPFVGNLVVNPDVYVERGELDHAYVEVERGRDSLQKWLNMTALQGFAAVCCMTMRKRRNLVEKEIMPMGIPGIATDLETLNKMANTEAQDLFWLDHW